MGNHTNRVGFCALLIDCVHNQLARMNPTSMPNSHLNKNQITGRILIIEDKLRKVCGDGSFREIKFKQTNSCFDASEPVNPRIRPGGHYQTHVVAEELPTLHANGEYVRQIVSPTRSTSCVDTLALVAC